MHVELHPRFASTPEGQKARGLTSACVHCGFCLPTCPTYADARDERDSPRGRIYLIKHFLESGEGAKETRLHLDRCLTCRNCETACPSGMQYGELLDIGRAMVEVETPRPPGQRVLRQLLRSVLTRPRVFGALLALGRSFRAVLPAPMRALVPAQHTTGALPRTQHARRMLLLQGCVQQAATPGTNAAARRVMDRLGITLVEVNEAGCCGAVDHHLSAQESALVQMRRNIDAWWPYIQDGAEAIVSCATGCGAMLADYGQLLADDPHYSDRARRISTLARDIGQVLLEEDLEKLGIAADSRKIACHTPCTGQHALGEPELVERIVTKAGFNVTGAGKTLCCGSAGTYSILERDVSLRLRKTTLDSLEKNHPDVIATANIGCQLHLGAAGTTPVVHWIELLDKT